MHQISGGTKGIKMEWDRRKIELDEDRAYTRRIGRWFGFNRQDNTTRRDSQRNEAKAGLDPAVVVRWEGEGKDKEEYTLGEELT
jgi:hypothetical protein